MIDNYISVLKKYTEFNGRATRTEYWLFQLVNLIIFMSGFLIATIIGGPVSSIMMPILGIYFIAIFLPSLAVTVRRLHDIGKSGWWILISLIPYIGSIVLLVFYILDSTPGDNMYGPNPKGTNGPVSESLTQDATEEIIEVEEVQ